jgi:hypothetical protein
MEFLVIVLIMGIVALVVMYLKKVLHITEEEEKLSEKKTIEDVILNKT